MYLTTLQTMAGTTSPMALLMDGSDSQEAPAISVWKDPDTRTSSVESSLTMQVIALYL